MALHAISVFWLRCKNEAPEKNYTSKASLSALKK